MAVSLALEPYRAFLADLAQDSLDPTVLQVYVYCTVIMRFIYSY